MSEYIFKLPDLGEGTVESEIGDWRVKVGDVVAEEDIVGTMMTDKAAIEITSPVSGTVTKLAGEPGDIIPVGAPLLVFETADKTPAKTSGASSATRAAPSRAKQAKAAAATTAAKNEARVVTSPAIRRRAKETGIDLTQLTGSGPGGRITRNDFDAYLDQQSSAAAGIAPPSSGRETREVKVIGLRRITAERMSAANREIPHFSYVEEIDITELEALRRQLNINRDKNDRLTLLPFLSLALVRALIDFPQCNATFDKERNVIIQHGPVHLGIATQTPDGLRVPVVRNAEQLPIGWLAREIRRVSEAARGNSIRRSELSGSTITITSLGKLGGIASTPVINMPEVAIVGVNRAMEKLAVINGQLAVRQTMNLSSSFDHRFVDGFDAAQMIQRVRQMLEHPA
ncbi:MAG: 2-oxo acid dehydrogenase subunit E2, partial [Halioglobus sp.]|nr:2-oxo acid dehydrogenase subunit E2 [Halioglobus sp.]